MLFLTHAEEGYCFQSFDLKKCKIAFFHERYLIKTAGCKYPLFSCFLRIFKNQEKSYVISPSQRTHHPLYLHGNPFWLMSIGYDEHEDGVALNKGNPHFKCKDEACTETEKTEEIPINYTKQFMQRTSVTVPVFG